jgi:hypothetical protein
MRSGKNHKRSYVFRADNIEVPSIQCRDDIVPQPFGKGDDRRVDGSQGQIAVSGYELCDPYPIAWENRRRSKVSRGEIAKESRFCDPAKSSLDEIGNLSDDELRDEQWPGMRFKKLQTCVVVAIVLVHVSVKRAGIDDQRD